MVYVVKITAEDGSVIDLGAGFDESGQGNCVTNVDIHLDTTDDNARQKSLVMLAKIKICGKITGDDNTKSIYKDLFDWAKSLEKSRWYREVYIEIHDDAGTAFRKYRFEKMFVVDYKEFYGVDSENGRFELFLTQKENLFKTIENY